MKSIYFAPTPWATSEMVLEDYRYQTPANAGTWDDIIAVKNPNEAEYIVIQDEIADISLLNRFSPKKRLYFNREALATHLRNQYPLEQFNRFSFWDGTGYLPVRWAYKTNASASAQGYSGIDKSYDELNSIEYNQKTKDVCCILSNKTMNEGHIIRKTFTKKFISKHIIDLYGTVEFKNCKLENNDKFSTLSKYKYCLGFDNQDFIKDFFGTQFTDAVLAWSVPIFWCGTDLRRYFPEGSFIQFNARENTEIDRIIDTLKNDDYNSRIAPLREARNLILNKYNFWPTIKILIDRE